MVDNYIQEYQRTAKSLPGNNTPWIKTLRDESINHLTKNGFPTRKNEQWKYTRVDALSKTPFTINDNKNLPEKESITSLSMSQDSYQLVFIDGQFIKEYSTVENLEAGVSITDLQTLLEQEPEQLEAFITPKQTQAQAFDALNKAFLNQGCLIRVAANTVVSKPITLHHISTQANSFNNLRHTIIAGANSSAVIIEHYSSMTDSAYFTNTMTDITLQDGAKLEHYKLIEEGQEGLHIANTQAQQNKNSHFTSNSFTIGGKLVRSDTDVNLAGEGAYAQLNGVFMGNGSQHIDHHTLLNHCVPHCNSKENYRGILSDKATGVFNGKIAVAPKAQKTNAHLSNKNLLLSPMATINTKPELEIFADDVKCSHGATVGQLDPNAIFYLQSRGISEAQARQLLTYGFASEIIESFSNDVIKHYCQERINKEEATHGSHA